MNKNDLNLFLMGQYPFGNLFKKELLPKIGNELFFCGMSLSNLKIIAMAFTYKKHYITECGFFSHYFIFGNSIKLRISISDSTEKCRIDEITFLGNYNGKYKGVGIGSKVSDLLKIREDIYVDEEYILVGTYPYDFIIKVDSNNSIESLDSIKNNLITHIIVEQRQVNLD